MGIMLALTLLAFALRVYRLDYQELRGDEAATWVYSIRSFAEMLQIYTIDAHPPLYYPLMHGWFPLAGTTEYALRYVPLVSGVLLVISLVALGSKLVDARTGLVIGFLAAVNPYEIYFAQDARSYPLATWLGVLSTLVLWQALRGPLNCRGLQRRWRDWIIYGVLTVVLAYTHYYFFLIVAFQALFVAWDAWQRRRIPWQYGVVGAVAVLAYLPWVIYAWGFLTGYRGNVESPDLIATVVRPLLAFAGGQFLAPPVNYVNGAVLWPLLVLGAVGLWHTNRRALLLAVLYLCVPLLAVFFVSRFKSIFSERYLVLASPGFLLLVGAGLAWAFGRRRTWLTAGSAAITVMFLVTGGLGLSNYYHNPAFAKSPPWRDILDYIGRKASPGDAIVYTAALPEINYYNERAGLLPTVLIPYEATDTSADVIKALQDTFAGHPRLWLIPVLAADAPASRIVEPWLDRHSARLDQVFFRAVHVGLYQSPTEFLRTMTQQPARFGPEAGQGSGIIQLEGFRFGKKASSPFTIAPGKQLPLTLVWRALGRSTTDYTVFTHVVGADERLWGQWDNPPVRGTYPTTQWAAGEMVFDQYLIPLKEDVPPGTYQVIVGLYEAASGERLSVLNDDGRVVGDSVQLSQPVIVRVEEQ